MLQNQNICIKIFLYFQFKQSPRPTHSQNVVNNNKLLKGKGVLYFIRRGKGVFNSKRKKKIVYNKFALFFPVTSLKILQSTWLMKCKDIVIMTFRAAKTNFLDT